MKTEKFDQKFDENENDILDDLDLSTVSRPNQTQKRVNRAASSHRSISELVDEAVRLLMREDQEDLAAVSKRAAEPEISHEDLLNDLKSHGKT